MKYRILGLIQGLINAMEVSTDMRIKNMHVAWLVALVALVAGCGSQELDSEVSPDSVETQASGLSSTDPILGRWQIYTGYVTSVDTNGNSYIEQTPTPSCWPVGTPLWRNITYSYTDSSGNRVYNGQRNYRNNCNTDAWTSATFTVCPCSTSLTEKYFTNSYTWTR